jgi:hypothetical protein
MTRDSPFDLLTLLCDDLQLDMGLALNLEFRNILKEGDLDIPFYTNDLDST